MTETLEFQSDGSETQLPVNADSSKLRLLETAKSTRTQFFLGRTKRDIIPRVALGVLSLILLITYSQSVILVMIATAGLLILMELCWTSARLSALLQLSDFESNDWLESRR